MQPDILPPGENITEKQLKLGYWFVTHKLKLRKWLVISLIVPSVALWLFAIGMVVKLYLVDYNHFRQMEREMPLDLVNPYALEAAQPKALSVKPVQTFEGTRGATDAVVEVTNPNKNFWATWSGRFVATGATTTAKTEFILPGETKQVMDLGIESPAPSNVRYDLRDVAWHKIDRHLIPDYDEYRDNRLRFEIKDVAWSSAASADGSETITRVTFTVTNRSAYSFWSVRFLADLYRGTALAAVNSVELAEFETGQTRTVEMVWVQDLKAISKVEITPEVNILDENVRMPQPGS
jgi:hypothetical protein